MQYKQPISLKHDKKNCLSNVKELDTKTTEALKEYNEDLFWCIQFSMMSFKCSKECHPDTYRGNKVDYKSLSFKWNNWWNISPSNKKVDYNSLSFK